MCLAVSRQLWVSACFEESLQKREDCTVFTGLAAWCHLCPVHTDRRKTPALHPLPATCPTTFQCLRFTSTLSQLGCGQNFPLSAFQLSTHQSLCPILHLSMPLWENSQRKAYTETRTDADPSNSALSQGLAPFFSIPVSALGPALDCFTQCFTIGPPGLLAIPTKSAVSGPYQFAWLCCQKSFLLPSLSLYSCTWGNVTNPKTPV